MEDKADNGQFSATLRIQRFNPDTDKIRVLNPTGFFIWQLCDGSLDVEGLVDQVRASFDKVPEVQVSEQIMEYVEEMVLAGFIGTLEDDGDQWEHSEKNLNK